MSGPSKPKTDKTVTAVGPTAPASVPEPPVGDASAPLDEVLGGLMTTRELPETLVASPAKEAPEFATPIPSTLPKSIVDRALGRRGPLRRSRVRRIVLFAVLLALYWFVPPVWRLQSGPVAVLRWDKVKGKTEAVIGTKEKGWITTKHVSHHLLNAVVSSEDGKFYQHHGFDWESLWDATKANWRHHRYVRGGSTISQQVVKMAFLGREKTLVRKAREAVGVTLMELLLTKDQILEWYINLAEFGDGVYGVKDGSWHYFKTKPELLTVEQSVHLALVLPSPNRWSGGLRKHSLTGFGQKRFAAILNNMRTSGFITQTQWATALTRGDFGRPIAGYAGMLAADEKSQELCPGGPNCDDSKDDAEGEDSDGDANYGDEELGTGSDPARVEAPSASPEAAAPPTFPDPPAPGSPP